MILNAFRIISVVLCALLSVLTMSGNIALQPTLYQCKSGWASYTPPAGFPTPRTDAKGLLTAVLAEKRLTVTHYDNLGREVRVARGSYTDFPENCRFTQPNSQNRYDFNFNGGALPELEVLGNPK